MIFEKNNIIVQTYNDFLCLRRMVVVVAKMCQASIMGPKTHLLRIGTSSNYSLARSWLQGKAPKRPKTLTTNAEASLRYNRQHKRAPSIDTTARNTPCPGLESWYTLQTTMNRPGMDFNAPSSPQTAPPQDNDWLR